MRQKLLAEGKTLYQTNYGEPGTGPVKALGIGNPQGGGGSGKCISGPQVSLIMLSVKISWLDSAKDVCPRMIGWRDL